MSYNYPDNVTLFSNPGILFRMIADELKKKIDESFIRGNKLYLAISGGKTPGPLFNLLAEEKNIRFDNVDLFWVDERMVPETSDESNFKSAINLVNRMPRENIHKINGLNDPEEESIRYAEEIKKIVPDKNNIPCFDWVWLGLGDDGHTASIFPGDIINDNITGVFTHPVTGQKRVSFTEKLINNSKEILFIITGKDKKEILEKVLIQKDGNLPASRIEGKIKWYLST